MKRYLSYQNEVREAIRCHPFNNLIRDFTVWFDGSNLSCFSRKLSILARLHGWLASALTYVLYMMEFRDVKFSILLFLSMIYLQRQWMLFLWSVDRKPSRNHTSNFSHETSDATGIYQRTSIWKYSSSSWKEIKTHTKSTRYFMKCAHQRS